MDITYQFMIPILEYFHRMTNSYGWAIILLTVLVRVLVWPLVVKSTQSMQKMSQMQPMMKKIQDKYKSDPEKFQKKMMEFYSKNKMNPLGGCLPTLVQLPVLFALFATFSGPPFGDKAVDVKVNVVEKAKSAEVKKVEVSGNNSPYVGPDGKIAKVVVFPGDSVVVEGESLDFNTRSVDGQLPADFKVQWKLNNIQKKDGEEPPATIDDNGHATFNKPGEYHVQAMVPGIAKHENFGPINGLGKVASGMDLLKPENFDLVVMIILFGATMYLSSKLTMKQPDPNQEMDEQQIIQQQTAKTMPIALSAMFFFIPLPSGVYVYMVVSNVIQTLQTWLVMKSPVPEFIDVTAGDDDYVPPPPADGDSPKGKKKDISDSGKNGSSKESESDSSKKKGDDGVKKITVESDTGETISLSTGKRKVKKKKK
ncbi:MAG TPA: membrane protein insertase YidC [Candidatus Melainabacteria bacterium]|nr:membrane protein insertase YidC [Candidatus Melainabacteria bacterium]